LARWRILFAATVRARLVATFAIAGEERFQSRQDGERGNGNPEPFVIQDAERPQ
jgi:hypothetical protein